MQYKTIADYKFTEGITYNGFVKEPKWPKFVTGKREADTGAHVWYTLPKGLELELKSIDGVRSDTSDYGVVMQIIETGEYIEFHKDIFNTLCREIGEKEK